MTQTPEEQGLGKSAKDKRKILIVQGDWECGMARLALDVQDHGHEVGKVVFCVPDYYYRIKGIQTHVYRQPIDQFRDWLIELVKSEGYDCFYLYNHYRPYNMVAWELSEELGIECYVFELGLIRPNCVTVFNRDRLPLKAIPARWTEVLNGGKPPKAEPMPPELCSVSTPAKMLIFGINFFISRLTAPLFPNFIDQRDMRLWQHFKHGVIHLWRYAKRSSDDEYNSLFAGDLSGKYYAVPLQVHSDTQISHCSDFKSIQEFIVRVVDSFEKHAPKDTSLVFKVHPMDRGYMDYTDLLTGLNHRIGSNRIYYVDRIHLPTLLMHAKGMVNINSSVGISALVHHTPVLALGRAVYDLPELAYQGDLDSFWTDAVRPTKARVDQFMNLLLSENQGRGTLSQLCFDVPGRCKIRWPMPFRERFFGSSDN